MCFQILAEDFILGKAFSPLGRIAQWALAIIVSIGLASTARAQAIDDIPLTSTTYIDSYYSNQNLGGATGMKNVVNAPGHNAEGSSVTRSLLALPAIPATPAGDTITSVTLNLYCYQYATNGSSGTWSAVAYPLEHGFVQGNGTSTDPNLSGATWFTSDGTNAWTTPSGGTTSGGAYDPSVSVMANAIPVIGEWTTFDLTNIWNNPTYAVQKQEMQNYGVELTVSPENPSQVAAGQWVTIAFRNDNAYPPPTPIAPYLEVTFTPPVVAWTGSFSSNWSNAANWNPNTAPNAPPNAVGAVAEFGDVPNVTVTVDSPVTVGSMVFDNSAHSYTISGGSSDNSITMESLSDESAITVIHGTHLIAAPLVLASNLTVTASNAGDALTLSGDISGTGFGLTLEGSGALFLGGDNSYDGGTTVNSGTLYVSNFDALPEGTSLTVGAGGTFIFDPSAAAGAAPSAGFAAMPVPEPSAVALLLAGTGLAALGFGKRYRARRSSSWPNVHFHFFSDNTDVAAAPRAERTAGADSSH